MDCHSSEFSLVSILISDLAVYVFPNFRFSQLGSLYPIVFYGGIAPRAVFESGIVLDEV